MAHLREVDLTSGPNQNSVGDGAPANLKYGQTADMTDEQFAELLERAVDGRDGAERYRDQCQVDLVNCIGKPVVGRRATLDSAEPLRPVVDRESTPPRHSEDG